MNQDHLPILETLTAFKKKQPISLHVPGHKDGVIVPTQAQELYKNILAFDKTELTNLDDLHAPEGIIAEAQALASEWFGSQHTFFLVNGSTVGNLAMILATCQEGDQVIIQRNCHKSVWSGIELSGATPILVAPKFDQHANRYTAPDDDQLKEAIQQYPEAKVMILTYPDYFGRTYDVRAMIKLAHAHDIVVLIDEAHGVHFSIDHPSFPDSAVKLGADAVVQSAHKMAPAMTMTAYLHLQSDRINTHTVAHYLTMLQSSSPSYPLLASLDSARHYLATRTKEQMDQLLVSTENMRNIFKNSNKWDVIPFMTQVDDPLKIILQVKDPYDARQLARLLEAHTIYPEMITADQLLFIHGLEPFHQWKKLEYAVRKISGELKNSKKHATIERNRNVFPKKIAQLVFSYKEMKKLNREFVKWEHAKGQIAAEQVVPYPPGIPLLVKGERIESDHIESIHDLIKHGIRFQQNKIHAGIHVFNKE